MTAAATRTLRLDGPYDLLRTLRAVRRGGLDPCMWLSADECWRATRTPEGPVEYHVRRATGALVIDAWGAGAGWALANAPALLGLDDDPAGFVPRLPLLEQLARRFPGIRVARTGAVAEALAPSVLEQKVTGVAARRSWVWLVRRLGEPAPGPGGLLLPPSPATLAATPNWVFHRANVERKRADTLARAMCRAARLEEAGSLPLAEAYARLQALPGVGAWTAAEVAHVALGDADAVSVGDFHLKNQVAWALAGRPRGTDEEMLELLAPWAGHRARVVQLLAAGGIHAPRYGPRLAHHAIARR